MKRVERRCAALNRRIAFVLQREWCSERQVNGCAHERYAVHVRAMIGRRSVLMGWHGVFVPVAALRACIAMRGSGRCGLMVHRAVAHQAEHWLGRRRGSQYQEGDADASAQECRLHEQ